ncbi:hypothetical protein EXIGLDRAFT_79203 [Exidia glandulosa HHB12029]|uniref:Uncharacterized protein n=1 Tax=Exidia glandulosa HHB12029 TaxID=1314781 RepID=A0A165HQ09_EXIGL|nr:hypothetical protein EXIGLDRAFT_79203 [Exidia glandulosa HHB12029]
MSHAVLSSGSSTGPDTPADMDVDMHLDQGGELLYRKMYDALATTTGYQRPSIGKRSHSRSAPHSPPRRYERLPGHPYLHTHTHTHTHSHTAAHPHHQFAHPTLPHHRESPPSSESSGSPPPTSGYQTPASPPLSHSHHHSPTYHSNALSHSLRSLALERERVREIVSYGPSAGGSARTTPAASRTGSPEREMWSHPHPHPPTSGWSTPASARPSLSRRGSGDRVPSLGSGSVWGMGIGMTPIHSPTSPQTNTSYPTSAARERDASPPITLAPLRLSEEKGDGEKLPGLKELVGR